MNLTAVSTIENREKLAVVVVGYNRLKSLRRLLDSLLNSKLEDYDVPLVISIDCSGDTELYDYVQNFTWPYGDKYLNIQNVRLGLEQHIYRCGDLTQYFKGIILLEDDLYVSPHFYSYTLQALAFYAKEERIAEISLYKNEINGYVRLPFSNEQNGMDVFLMQDVSTWGQCWTYKMWSNFKKWKEEHDESYIQSVNMPDIIKGWTRAWSRYYNAYVVDTKKYVLYPNVSLTTNFSDAGEHGGDNNSLVQVNLQQSDFKYRFAPIDKLVTYDIFFNNENIYKWLNIEEKDLSIDLYAFLSEDCRNKKRYLLTTSVLGYKIVKSYALYMRPIELNIKYNIQGNGIMLYDTTIAINKKIEQFASEVVPYFLQGFGEDLISRHIVRKFLHRIFKRRCLREYIKIFKRALCGK